MCGITGYWARGANDAALWNSLSLAVASLQARGPDDRGVWRNDLGVGLGHARLAILDLSPSGHQPMVTEDGRLAIAFNGEVYNYREIREVLSGCGYRFHGQGDTEVVLAAFHRWGMQALDRFIGMFAIALWDRQARRMYLIRDRVGVKPLYYGWNGKLLCFGSELKSLRAYPHWQPEIDRQALGEYFQYGRIASPRSIYRDVFQLPPGHWLVLGEQGPPELHRYWSVVRPHTVQPKHEEEYEAELESLLIDAFRYRMVSDVPVGVFLSGGIDSSLVAALLQRHAGQRIHTFTVGFNEQGHDESVWARRVAEHLGTNHTETMLDVSEAREILPHWGDLFDEPFGDSSGIPTYLVARTARSQVKVALSADGGDELFGGYAHYGVIHDRYAALHRMPGVARQLLGSALNRFPIENYLDRVPLPRVLRHRMRRHLLDRISKLRHMLPSATGGRIYDMAHAFWMPGEIGQLLGAYPSSHASLDAYPGSFYEQMTYADFHDYLPNDILTKVDRTTMAVGLEGREPLLDHRIAEFAFALPWNLRQGELGPKHLLRKILYRYVPRQLLDRPKQGFSIPLSQWLRGDLAELVQDYLSPQRIRRMGVLNVDAVQTAVRNFYDGGPQGDRIDVEKVWLLLAFEMWQERWGVAAPAVAGERVELTEGGHAHSLCH